MAGLLALALPLASEAGEVSTAEEGLHIIIGMLIVGLIFISVILVGELSRYLRHRR